MDQNPHEAPKTDRPVWYSPIIKTTLSIPTVVAAAMAIGFVSTGAFVVVTLAFIPNAHAGGITYAGTIVGWSLLVGIPAAALLLAFWRAWLWK